MQARPLIEILWHDRKLAKSCGSDSAGQRRFGAQRWKLLRRRLAAIAAAPTLADLLTLSAFHALHTDRSGQYAGALDGPYRLILQPETSQAGSDPSQVTAIGVVEVVDYHGR